jgi:hypothetical protein
MHLCNWISKFVAYGVRDNNLKKFAIVQFFVTYNFYFFNQLNDQSFFNHVQTLQTWE